ncbi:MAG: GatB/YqeY domain-containing protein, partial [Patescibacteria group bacterium]
MLKEQIEKDLVAAMKNKERRLSILRMLRAALQNAAIEKRTKAKDLKAELDEKEILDVVRRQVKQLKESLQDFQNGHRADLVEKTKEELDTLEKYVPAGMPEAELEKIVE